MGAEVVLRESYAKGGVGVEVEFSISFAPVSTWLLATGSGRRKLSCWERIEGF